MKNILVVVGAEIVRAEDNRFFEGGRGLNWIRGAVLVRERAWNTGILK